MKNWDTPIIEELSLSETKHGAWDGAEWDGVFEGGMPFNPDDEDALS